jgi:hypothetical protein
MKKTVCLITLFVSCALFIAGCGPSEEEITTMADSAPTPTPIPLTPTPFREGDIITVTSTSDSGPGSLRQALEDAQPYDTITFDPAVFPPDAPATIFITSELPFIQADYLTLDASNAGVILDGSDVSGEWVAGLQIVSSSGNKIMGLQISNFPGPGIAISGDAKHNLIGGDRSLGAGPFGQGNLITLNAIGIDLSTSGVTLNTITGNLIGAEGLGNQRDGVSFGEGAHGNIIGPNNIIAYNGGQGIADFSWDALQNTITQNSIYNNIGKDILLEGGSISRRLIATIFDFDLSEGTVTGGTCPNCTVEIFSDSSDGGETYEGTAVPNDLGVFTFNKGEPFSGPYLTLTTTSPDGTTSEFSSPTSGTARTLTIQQGSNLFRTPIQPKLSSELSGNYIGGQFDNFAYPETYDLWLYQQGVTRARVGIEGLECTRVDWDQPEFSVDPAHEEVFNRMADNGLDIIFVLTFWDKDSYASLADVPKLRFKTEEGIEHYLTYVRWAVDHFKDRVEYFEIWNEPELRWWCPQGIDLADYINLVKRTVPVIRAEYPEAKIVVGNVANTNYPGTYNYLFGLLESEIMPLVDVISFHPMYGPSPEYDNYIDYYYNYPVFLQSIKDTAEAHGFVGEYHADELTWRTADNVDEGQPWTYSEVAANKYFGRGALMNLGAGVRVSIGADYFMLPNLSTVMDGTEPAQLSVEVQSSAENIVSYSFSTPDSGYLVALWTNGIAVDDDPGVETTLTIPGFSASEVIGIDVLYGIEQELIFEMVDGNLIVYGLLVKDYPILLRITGASSP